MTAKAAPVTSPKKAKVVEPEPKVVVSENEVGKSQILCNTTLDTLDTLDTFPHVSSLDCL